MPRVSFVRAFKQHVLKTVRCAWQIAVIARACVDVKSDMRDGCIRGFFINDAKAVV